MKDDLQRDLILALFHGMEIHMLVWEVPQILENQVDLALTESILSSSEIWKESSVFTFHLVDTIWGQVEFWSGDHAILLKNGGQIFCVRTTSTIFWH